MRRKAKRQMTGWIEYAIALALFAGSHFLPRVAGVREALIGQLGRRAYFALYGLLSLALLAWVIAAAGRAPFVELWPQTAWARWVPNLALPIATLLVTCGIGLPNPYTLGGKRGAEFDPARPGFAAVSRHPLFMALLFWSAAHLAPNGDLAHVILFGSFGAMALSAIAAFDAQAHRAMGDGAKALFTQTSFLSPAPLADRTWRRKNGRQMAGRAILGVILWLAALHLHEAALGVSPFPM